MTEGKTSVRSKIAWTVLMLAGVLLAIALTQFNLSAQQEPGPVETAISNRAKRFFIRRASRHGIPSRPVDLKASIENGATYYGLECSICHADDGRAQREPGRWEYPRAADLTSKRVQSYSDEELFWIIQNGIRNTGMPSFGKVETPDHIWDVVNYLRTLPGDLRTQGSSKEGARTASFRSGGPLVPLVEIPHESCGPCSSAPRFVCHYYQSIANTIVQLFLLCILI